ncbi:hypothetical protein V1509DRAFT_632867 [Lipomyces kononenkoae]
MSLDAPRSTESLPPTRQMRLKVLYTFDNAQRTTCLARGSSMYSVHVVPCPPSSPSSTATSSSHSLLGVISLRSCLAAVASASPELVSDPESDYAVYTVDYSERDAPLVGHGLLSWALSAPESSEGSETIGAEMTGTSSSSCEGLQQMVCGRVCSNLLAVFAGGVRETLEIKLRLSPVPGVSQMRYMRSMQLYARLSKVLPGSFDPSVWSNFVASNPQAMQLLTAPAYATSASPSDTNNPSIVGTVSRDKTADFEAFLGLPPNLPSDMVGNAGPKRARPKPSNSATKKSRQPLDDLASSSLNVANNANTPTTGPPARKPRSSSSRPRKPRTQSARVTPAAAVSDGITSVIDDDNDSHSLPQQPPQKQDHTLQSNGPRHASGTTQSQTQPPRNPMLPHRQGLIRATTAPPPSIFSPASSLCSTNSPYVESPQLASSPPVSGPHDSLSPLFEGPIPKAWTVDFDDKTASSHDQSIGATATSPTTASFDELMNSTLSLDDPDVFLSGAAENDAAISLANDFVKEFYRFESETEESSCGADLNVNGSDVGISTDADMTDAIDANVIEGLVMETHNSQPRIQISRTKSGSSSSSTGAGSDGFDEDPTQNMSPITSPTVVDKEVVRRARSSTPKIEKGESEPAAKARSRVSAKIKERIHESLMQDLAAGKVPRYCENCGDIKTSTWRKIRAMTVNNKMEDMWLCNPCGLYFASKKLMRPQHLWRDDGLPLSSDALDMDVTSESGLVQGNTPITPKLFGPGTPAATVATIAIAPDGSDTKKRKVEEIRKSGGEVEDGSE